MPFIGEYDCRVDSKGRLRLPNQLIRQMDGKGTYSFVITRGFENCLIMYEEGVWNEKSEALQKLNVFNRKERKFIRHFLLGASKITMDTADRINLSKRQIEFAGIEKDAVLTSLNDRIEIWSKDAYEEAMKIDSDEFSELAEDVMGGEQDDDLISNFAI